MEQVTQLVLVPENVQLPSLNSLEAETLPIPLPYAPTLGRQVGGQHCWTHCEADELTGAGAARLF